MKRLQTALAELEQAMKDRQLWESEAPSPQDLASTAPFCCDTLDFNQWLQFVFVPKMTQMIEQNQPLPGQCDLSSMGIHYVAQKGLKDVMPFLKSLKKIDSCFNQPLN